MALQTPLSPTWLSRFEEWLPNAFYSTFTSDWGYVVKTEEGMVCAIRNRDGSRVCVRIHPGMPVVIPHYAARRVVSLLRDAAVAAGYLPPSQASN